MPSILNATTSSGLVTSADNSGSLQLATNNGTTAVTIDTSQNVGIGTASPSAKLEVAGAVRSLRSGSTAAVLQVINDNNSWNITSGTSSQSFSVDNNLLGRSLNIDSSNNFQFNSGYGSVATAYGCRAWVNFNGTGTVAIRSSGNVSSITDRGTGRYTVNITTALPDANGSVVASVSANGTTDDKNRATCCNLLSTSTATVNCFACTNEADTDVNFAQVAVFR